VVTSLSSEILVYASSKVNFFQNLVILFASAMATSGDFGNPLRKFKLVFLGEQSVGE
jgi:hypothetical protein